MTTKRVSPPSDARKLVREAADELLCVFTKNVAEVGPADAGLPTGAGVRQFMRRWLPKRYGACRGHVINHWNLVSQLANCIVFDAATCPKLPLKKAPGRLVPLGHTFGAIELKPALDRMGLFDACVKLKSVTSLSSESVGGAASTKSIDFALMEGGKGKSSPAVVSEWRPSRVPVTALIAFGLVDGLTITDVVEECVRDSWGPDLVLVLDSGYLIRETGISRLSVNLLRGADMSNMFLDPGDRLKMTIREAPDRPAYLLRSSPDSKMNLMTFLAVYLDLLNLFSHGGSLSTELLVAGGKPRRGKRPARYSCGYYEP